MKNYKDLLHEAESLFKDLRSSSEKRLDEDNYTGKIIAAAAVGLAVGAVLGLLFAPASGAETRSSISDSVNNAGGAVRDKARQGMDKLTDLKQRVVETVKSKSNGTSENIPAV